ncbi:MAG TPA: amidase domain-containing protein [Clostridiaceae bacterium]|nr:amidase domain-containing protein [Clostridiaceae bacterium]
MYFFRTLREMPYNRAKAVDYAHRWAYGRNPSYYDFEHIGGDCTNFASQCIYAGSGVMNFTPVYGWYYIDSYNRTPSWTGVNYLYNFLVGNKGVGPYAEEVDVEDIKPGDIIQLSFGGGIFHHSPVVVSTGYPVKLNNILVAAHTDDVDNYPLVNYQWEAIRFLSIKGVRVYN